MNPKEAWERVKAMRFNEMCACAKKLGCIRAKAVIDHREKFVTNHYEAIRRQKESYLLGDNNGMFRDARVISE